MRVLLEEYGEHLDLRQSQIRAVKVCFRLVGLGTYMCVCVGSLKHGFRIIKLCGMYVKPMCVCECMCVCVWCMCVCVCVCMSRHAGVYINYVLTLGIIFTFLKFSCLVHHFFA